MKSKFHPSLKIIAGILIITFLTQDVVCANPDTLQVQLRTSRNRYFNEAFSREYQSAALKLSKAKSSEEIIDLTQIKDAESLSNYIDNLQKDKYALLSDPEKYENDFLKPLFELFFIRLEKDFMNSADFITYCRQVLEKEGSYALRQKINSEELLFTSYFEKMFKKPDISDVSVGFYGLLLFYLTTKQKPYLRHIYRELIRDRPAVEIALGRKGISYRTRGDSIVHLYPPNLVFAGPKAVYANSLSDMTFETSPCDVRGLPKANDAKILNGIEAWKRHVATYPYSDEQRKLLEKRIRNFETGATVIELKEMKTQLLFSDPEHNVVRLVHTGRSRQVLYISKQFLDNLRQNDEEDMKWLAVWLNVHQRFIDTHDEMAAAGRSPQEIQDVLSEFNMRFFEMEDSHLVGKDKLRERLAALMEEDTLTKYSDCLSSAIMEEEEADVVLKLLEQRLDSVTLGQIGQAKRAYHHLLYRYEGLGLHSKATRAYKNMEMAICVIQSKDKGFLPIQHQVDIIFAALGFQRWFDFFNELNTLLTGIGYPRLLRSSEIELSKYYITPSSPDHRSFEDALRHGLSAQKTAATPETRIIIEEVKRAVDGLLKTYFANPFGNLRPGRDIDADTIVPNNAGSHGYRRLHNSAGFTVLPGIRVFFSILYRAIKWLFRPYDMQGASSISGFFTKYTGTPPDLPDRARKVEEENAALRNELIEFKIEEGLSKPRKGPGAAAEDSTEFSDEPALNSEPAAAAPRNIRTVVEAQIFGLDGIIINDKRGEIFELHIKCEAGPYPIKINIERKADRRNVGEVQFGIYDGIRPGTLVLRLGNIGVNNDMNGINYQNRELFTVVMSLVSDSIPKGSKLTISSLEEIDTLRKIARGQRWDKTKIGWILQECGWDVRSVSITDLPTSKRFFLLDRDKQFGQLYNPGAFKEILKIAVRAVDGNGIIKDTRISVELEKTEASVFRSVPVARTIPGEPAQLKAPLEELIDGMADMFGGYKIKDTTLLDGLVSPEKYRIRNRALGYVGEYLFKMLLLDYVTTRHPDFDNLTLHKFINDMQSKLRRDDMLGAHESAYARYAGTQPASHYSKWNFITTMLGALVADTGDIKRSILTGRHFAENYFDGFKVPENSPAAKKQDNIIGYSSYDRDISRIESIARPFIEKPEMLRDLLMAELAPTNSGKIGHTISSYTNAALGDAILDFIVSFEISETYGTGRDAVFYRDLRNNLVKGKFSADVMMALLGNSKDELSNIDIENGENLFEALVAIVYKANGGVEGNGLAKARDFIFKMFRDYIEQYPESVDEATRAFSRETPTAARVANIYDTGNEPHGSVLLGDGYAKVGSIYFIRADLPADFEKNLPVKPGQIVVRMEGLSLSKDFFSEWGYGQNTISMLLMLQRLKDRSREILGKEFGELTMIDAGAGPGTIGITAALLGASVMAVENNNDINELRAQRRKISVDHVISARRNIGNVNQRSDIKHSIEFKEADITDATTLKSLPKNTDIVLIDMPKFGYKEALQIIRTRPDIRYLAVAGGALNDDSYKYMTQKDGNGFVDALMPDIRIERIENFEHSYERCPVILYKITRVENKPESATKNSGITYMLSVIHSAMQGGIATNPFPEGSKVLLSKNLFESTDSENLERLLKGGNVEILDKEEIMRRATNNRVTKDKMVIVLTNEEFNNKTMWNDSNKNNLRSSVLLLDGRLTGANYLYLEGVVGLAKAIMQQDKQAIRSFYQMLSAAPLDESALDQIANDAVAFAIRAILRLKPIDVRDPEELNRYKAMMENLLMSA